MSTAAAMAALDARHAAFRERRRVVNATSLPLNARETWPAFWRRANHALCACGYARSSREQYRRVLRGLRAAGIMRPADVTPAKVRQFIHAITATGASWSWIALNIAVLRTVFDRLGGYSVTQGLVTPKRPDRLPEILSEDDAVRLLQACRTLRDQLLLGLMYGCGLTAREVSRLRWGDVYDKGTRLSIAGSQRYMVRVQKVPAPLIPVLRLGSTRCPADDYIFRGREPGTALSIRMVERVVQSACRRARLPHPVTGMTLRHSYAVHRLESGAGVTQVRHELGHASVRTTERYLRCIAPRLDRHPYRRVSRLMGKGASRGWWQPLARLTPIDMSAIKLPFPCRNAPSRAAEFARCLKNRWFCSLFGASPPRR